MESEINPNTKSPRSHLVEVTKKLVNNNRKEKHDCGSSLDLKG